MFCRAAPSRPCSSEGSRRLASCAKLRGVQTTLVPLSFDIIPVKQLGFGDLSISNGGSGILEESAGLGLGPVKNGNNASCYAISDSFKRLGTLIQPLKTHLKIHNGSVFIDLE